MRSVLQALSPVFAIVDGWRSTIAQRGPRICNPDNGCCNRFANSCHYVFFVAPIVWLPSVFTGQKLRTLGADQMDSFGKRRHDPVGLSVGTGDARGSQDATQNVWSGQHRRSIQTSKEEQGVTHLRETFRVRVWVPSVDCVPCGIYPRNRGEGGGGFSSGREFFFERCVVLSHNLLADALSNVQMMVLFEVSPCSVSCSRVTSLF